MARFVEGQPPGEIAEDRGLSERTVDNQLRVGCHKLGFRDRREMKGWAAAANQFLLSQPPGYRMKARPVRINDEPKQQEQDR